MAFFILSFTELELGTECVVHMEKQQTVLQNMTNLDKIDRYVMFMFPLFVLPWEYSLFRCIPCHGPPIKITFFRIFWKKKMMWNYVLSIFTLEEVRIQNYLKCVNDVSQLFSNYKYANSSSNPISNCNYILCVYIHYTTTLHTCEHSNSHHV